MVFCLQVRFSLITGVCVWPRTSFAATTGEDLLHLKLSSVMERSKLSALPSEQWCTSQQTFYNSKKTKWLRLAKRSAADPLFQVEAKQLSEWHVPFLTCQLSLTAEASLSESTLSSTSSWPKRQPARYTENWDGATCMFSNLFFYMKLMKCIECFEYEAQFFWTQELDPRVWLIWPCSSSNKRILDPSRLVSASHCGTRQWAHKARRGSKGDLFARRPSRAPT